MCNLLLLSDNHLGEYIKEHARIDYLKKMGEIDKDLCDFFEYYANNRQGGRPWRLVINGDFLDFLTVTVRPSDEAQQSTPGLALDPEELLFGLDSDEEKVVWKLERMFERHRLAFTFLADFVGKGNYLEMLYGNHDAEFFWSEAKDTFVRLLVDVYFGSERVPGHSRREFASRVRWHEWFYYEPGEFYIEHGSQYDDFSSFEYRLCPIVPFRSDDLAMPVSHMIIHYFVNHMEGFRTHGKDNWTMVDFLRWLIGQGWDKSKFIIKSYIEMSRRIIRYARTLQEADHSEVKAAHEAAMEDQAERYGLEAKTVRDIDALRNTPVHYTTTGAIQAGSVDIWAYMLCYMVLLAGMLTVFSGWKAKLVVIVVWSGLVMARKHIIRGFRNLFMGGEVSTVVAPKLDEAAERLARLLDVRYVIMGHTHKPVVRKVRHDPPCYYINTGAWLAPEKPERHRGGCRSALTYAVIDVDEREHQLLRWCQKNSCPEEFEARLHADEDVPERTTLRDPTADVGVAPPSVDTPASTSPKRLQPRTGASRTTGRTTRPTLRKRR